jgi:hypothetical protein
MFLISTVEEKQVHSSGRERAQLDLREGDKEPDIQFLEECKNKIRGKDHGRHSST